MTKETLAARMARATALQRRGDSDGAAAIYRQILKENGAIAPAHYNLALLLKAAGKAQAAEKSFRAALAADPDYRLGWRGFARFLLEREKHQGAVRAALKFAALEDYAPAALQEVADILEQCGTALLGPAGDEAMLRCLNSEEVESDRFIHALLARIFRQAGIRKSASGGDSLSILWGAFNEPVIAAAFAMLVLPSPEIGEMIADARDILLAGEAEAPEEVRALIALQLDRSEYILPASRIPPPPVTDLDSALTAALHAPLAPEDAVRILEREAERLALLPWSALLLSRMGPERVREAEIAAALPSLSRSDDATSRAVAAQYEASPYPRWRGLRSGGRRPLGALLSEFFPGTPFAPLPARPAVLVAGAGTGRHALRTGRRIEGAQVTAIDLSRAALAYGARQAEELGIQNVSFARADLVRLPETLGRFDLIEVCGVLHHMADPEAAWRGLLRHLAPNGVMKVALYSELARQDVVAARAWIGRDPGTLTLDEMRRLREELLKLPDDHPARGVTRELDFYSLSGCRDLVFHASEQRFDMARLQAAIRDLGLEFLGFEFVDPKVMAAYRARHPGDPAGRNLKNWAAIEAENPQLFRGMYQFWCRAEK
ncbi:methyltransferase domain-containing protein [Sneathiella sp.]|uniref:methyltransferase domain-containing protein n=1 Tax=Sneathiella sp. TaxID=1964365 RepID=UPI002FE1A45C